MNLTGKQLIMQGIIFGPSTAGNNIQQHGVDLNLIKVERVDGSNFEGVVYDDKCGKKTNLAQRYNVELREDIYGKYWYLESGAYDITFSQGCHVPPDKRLFVVQRSSLLRNGTIIHSSLFDAGFETKQMGTVMIVTTPIKIYYNARIAQAYVEESDVVENLYNGQFQGDCQRNLVSSVNEEKKA